MVILILGVDYVNGVRGDCRVTLKVLVFVKGVLWTTHGSLSRFLPASSY
jgi:hypothetical protein